MARVLPSFLPLPEGEGDEDVSHRFRGSSGRADCQVVSS
jgi:hypothetical protein